MTRLTHSVTPLASLIQQELENGRGLSQDDDGELVRTGEAPGSSTDGGHDSYDNDPGSYDYGDEPETGY